MRALATIGLLLGLLAFGSQFGCSRAEEPADIAAAAASDRAATAPAQSLLLLKFHKDN